MAAQFEEAKITYDGDGQLKYAKLSNNANATVSSENGEWFITVEMNGNLNSHVLYAPETDNYAAAVLEFTTSG